MPNNHKTWENALSAGSFVFSGLLSLHDGAAPASANSVPFSEALGSGARLVASSLEDASLMRTMEASLNASCTSVHNNAAVKAPGNTRLVCLSAVESIRGFGISSAMGSLASVGIHFNQLYPPPMNEPDTAVSAMFLERMNDHVME